MLAVADVHAFLRAAAVVDHVALRVDHRDVADEARRQGLEHGARLLVEERRVPEPFAAQSLEFEVEHVEQAGDLLAHGVGQLQAALLRLRQHLLAQLGLRALRLPPQEAGGEQGEQGDERHQRPG
jgi:hypothetical protein